MNKILLIILGSVLALATSFVMEIYKSWKDNRESAKNLKIILKLELKNITQVIDRLIERYGSVSYYDFKIIGQLASGISRLDQTRERVVHLKQDQKKEEVLSCINSLSIFQSDLYSLESQAFSKDSLQSGPTNWQDEYYKSQRQILATRSVDVKRRIQDLLNYFEQ